jgi:hypothetical protein
VAIISSKLKPERMLAYFPSYAKPATRRQHQAKVVIRPTILTVIGANRASVVDEAAGKALEM